MSQLAAIIAFILCILAITTIVFYKTIITKEWRNRAPGESESWYLIVFYFNPRDKRLFIPKRTGLGWTINFAQPLAIVMTLLILGAIVSFMSVV
jgi:uncharacterized membrane protein